MKLTKTEIKILYYLTNYQLNTIGEVETYLQAMTEPSKGYMWQMEKLEQKLANAAFGLKPK